MCVPKKIILIIIDTLRADHLGCYGYGRDTSPFLDGLARDGVMFKHAFSPCSFTLPSIASILTARYPSKHTIAFNQIGRLDSDQDITLAEALGSQGYRTAAFISTIVVRKESGLDAGFDVYDDDLPTHELNRAHVAIRDGRDTADKALKWILDNKDENFFVLLHFMDVHGPYLCPEPYDKKFLGDGRGTGPRLRTVPDGRPMGGIPEYQVLRPERDGAGNLTGYETDAGYYVSQYDGNISYVDDIVARLAAELKDKGIYDEALLLITSDHGEAMGENNVYFFHGLTVTSEQILVPLIVKPHERWNAGRLPIETPVSGVDLMPTILSLCGCDYSKTLMDGRSLKGLIENGKDPVLSRRTLMSENEYQYALIRPDGTMDIIKKSILDNTFYPCIPELIDQLNGKKYFWDTGAECTLTLPFDIYQRYRMVSDVVNKYRKPGKAFKILEVGAGYENNLKKFLPRDDIYLLDIDYPPVYRCIKNSLAGDFTDIELKEQYDFIVTIDTFEHVPAERREKFVEKLVAGSRVASILTAPFDTPGVNDHEVFANELYNASRGYEYRWLKEHIRNGLPSLKATLGYIEKSGLKYRVLPNGYLHRWFEMMTLYLSVEGRPEFNRIFSELSEFYNKNFYRHDNREPSYRKVIVMAKTDAVPDLGDLIAKETDEEALADKRRLLDSLISKIKEESGIKALEAARKEQDMRIGELNDKLAKKNEEFALLRAQVNGKDEQIKMLLQANDEKAGQLDGKDEELALLRAQVNGKDEQIKMLLQANDEKAGQLDSIRRSMTWRAVQGYHKAMETALPPGTRRRTAYDQGFNSIRIITREGLTGLRHHYNERKAVKRKEKSAVEINNGKRANIYRLEDWHGEAIIFPDATDAVDVSIIVPVFNKSKYTYNCLLSLQKHTRGKFEMIVVDDASTDDTGELLQKVENIVVINNTNNIGFIESCNKGAARAKGQYLLFLNNDTVVTENWLEPLLETIRRDDVGAVGARLVYPDGKLQEAGCIVWADASGWNYGRGDDPEKPEYNFVREVDYCSGAALMVKKGLFEKNNGFDVLFKPAYYEDADMCFAIRRMGYRVMYQPGSVVVHFEGATSGKDVGSGVKKYQEINKSKFYEKWHDVLLSDHHTSDAAALFAARSRKKGLSILVIDQYVPNYDRDAGSYRMYQILKILAELGHNVTFIGDNLARQEPYTSALQRDGVETIYGPYAGSVEEYLSMHGRIFDIVILSRANFAGKYISNVKKYCTNARVIYDTVDLHFLRESRRAKVEGSASALDSSEKYREMEFRTMEMSDITLVVSPIEKELIVKENPGIEVEVVSIIQEIYGTNVKFSERKDLMFVGNFIHPPNVDAVKWFVKDIFPLVKNKSPGVKFYVIGSEANEEIISLASNDVIIVGYVKDLKPYFEMCRAFVAPLRYGAGVKGKINMSMGYGLPVITTAIGAEGMGLIDGEDVLIADSPDTFAQKVLEVYNNEDLWDKISTGSIKNVKENYSYEVSKDKLDRIINKLVTPLKAPEG